ncbi:MAG: HAD family hydrolase [Actinomycetota bacterium]|nr:HAD family hydrolase [Actinomycetota bacterium]
MTVLAASDLDRTLIYSAKAARLRGQQPPVVCVEIHDGKQVSFMTAVAAQALVALAAAATLVPVTTRIPAQFERVTLPGPAPKYAIAANGGILYIDGEQDRAWSAQMARALAGSFPLADVWEQAGHVCRPDWTIKLRNAAELFCYAVVRPERLPDGFVSDISGWAAERGWRVSLQGHKLYWVPEALTKSAAVAEVGRRIGADLVLAAGDSLLDTDLLLAADRGIHPRHGELYDTGWSAPNVVQTTAAGVCAGEEIVEWFAAMVAGVSDGGGAR